MISTGVALYYENSKDHTSEKRIQVNLHIKSKKGENKYCNCLRGVGMMSSVLSIFHDNERTQKK